MKSYGFPLRAILKSSEFLREVRKTDVRSGDYIFVRTVNSVYTLRKLPKGYFLVSGGWFDTSGLSPLITTVTGCTWGGSAIKTDSLAACGLRLEFGNSVLTSPIQTVVIISKHILN
jgi:hypothetical protein